MYTTHYSTSWRITGEAAALRVILERIDAALSFGTRPQLAGEYDPTNQQYTLWLYETDATIGLALLLRRPAVDVQEVRPEEAPNPEQMIAGTAFRLLLAAA